ncbi:hypothetical protein LJR143_001865 [Pseudoxanthomonas sp. LjRoot143]|uniref:hypothetical protein n=1 Tax=Pseudoxanthomonas sp. LjRoot143 TaxID=3342266 RepID=UPI003ECD1038
MKRLSSIFAGGRAEVPLKDNASGRPPATQMQLLLAAIDGATLVRRQPDTDGERFIVGCEALGGMFMHSREEVERRILAKFPQLPFDDVSAAARYLNDRIRAEIQLITQDRRRAHSWALGWVEER